tara:strand:+ start:4219 stop:4392 length:174 start_codon:yes stop_codon:yes gene_type:complete
MSRNAADLLDDDVEDLLNRLNLPKAPALQTPPPCVTADPDWRADVWLLSQQLERGSQ